jgi:hypothetical protein
VGSQPRMDPTVERIAKQMPGAGSYDPKDSTFNSEKPKFHMGATLSYDIHKRDVPGPGEHNPTDTKQKAP